MPPQRRHHTSDPRGFSLVELAALVAVVGILAAVTLPVFVRQIRMVRTAEAVDRLAFLYRQSASYWSSERFDQSTSGRVMVHQFPDPQPPTPAAVPAGTRVLTPPAAWGTPTWQALSFALTEPHYFAYAYDSSGTNAGAGFTARALGDLDGDGVCSTFERAGVANAELEVQGSQGLWMQREMQ
jgi:type II secretory pathway pseudopilin PulG